MASRLNPARPMVGTGLASFCTGISIAGAIFLSCMGLAYNANVEVLMGSTKSPHDNGAVARNCFIAALVYVGFIVFCCCQLGVNRRYARGAVRL